MNLKERITGPHIKNSVVIILDTSKEDSIKIGKYEEPPTSMEAMKEMLVLDIATLCEALIVTIRTSKDFGLNEGELMKSSIDQLTEAFMDSNMETYSPLLQSKL